MKSMTGFAHGEFSHGTYSITIDIKSYNSRFLELSVYVPSFMNTLEFQIRDFLSSGILRGKVEVSVKLKELNPAVSVNCNENYLKKYYEEIKRSARAAGIKENPGLKTLLSLEGVLTSEKEFDTENYAKSIMEDLETVFKDFDSSRIKEGMALKKDLEEKIEKLEEVLTTAKKYSAEMEETFKNNLKTRLQEVAGDLVDEQRILQETALMLVKYTINEEIVRLAAHISSLRDELESNPAPGKKIDFICQEINREINTIGSKNQNLEVAKAVINGKDSLENIREQAKNIE